ncbi:hypothetical protein SS50377_22713 [Spironucleus salmonicida]|uniref:Transmembrane protein n=1 Tax=Spironucleus salmonicida TaxID=348837 RepID=V6LI02_9EUKA|nr:hypothetical protein SS50377_22713 [Spironucleus salmonicida]|eukprot:EST44190.1 Hypothetical protein SS50377_15996 [Spironucleus salmonicida]
MLIILCFTCQMDSSKVIINPITNLITLQTIPKINLKASELKACQIQTNKTAIYEVQIGKVLFRSNFEFYDAFSPANILLMPQGGDSAEDATIYIIASYQITFLDDNLAQSSAVGQLLETYYNYNDCIQDSQIQFSANIKIQPFVKINPNCVIRPTGDITQVVFLKGEILQRETVPLALFDFSNLKFKEKNCISGTNEENLACRQQSVSISSDNFIDFEVEINLPMKIVSTNIYKNPYGILETILTDVPFTLVFQIKIDTRISDSSCVSQSGLSFSENVIHVFQTPGIACAFQNYYKTEYWIVIQDSRNNTFQLQFLPNSPFDIDDYITCETWEISQFGSLALCNAALYRIQTLAHNASLNILYKAWSEDGAYLKSYIFRAQTFPGGQVVLVLVQKQLCVEVKTRILTGRAFARIELKLAVNLEHFADRLLDFEAADNFVFPSTNNIYCFRVSSAEEFTINQVSFTPFFGVLYVLGSELHVQSIDVLVEYGVFWEGWVLLVLGVVVMVLWTTSLAAYSRKQKQKIVGNE